MNNKKRVRKVAIVLACILIPVGAFGFGYFYRDKGEDHEVANTLTVDGDIEVTVTDAQGIVPGDTVEKKINIKPNATAPSLLRVKIEPSWYNGTTKTDLSTDNIEFIYVENTVKPDFTTEGKDYWYKNETDGYLYYMNSVTTKQEAMKIVEGIKLKGGTDDTDALLYQGKKLKIKVMMDMIQCKYAPYKSKWKSIEVNSDLDTKLEALCQDTTTSIE